MKKIITLVMIALITLSLSACRQDSSISDTSLDAISGVWKSEMEDIIINGHNVEIKGYYELDGQKLAGVITPCKLETNKDNTYKFTCDDNSFIGEIKDDTLIIGDITYHR